jgi:hypothetical protein
MLDAQDDQWVLSTPAAFWPFFAVLLNEDVGVKVLADALHFLESQQA